jgi:hypothetical protein
MQPNDMANKHDALSMTNDSSYSEFDMLRIRDVPISRILHSITVDR